MVTTDSCVHRNGAGQDKLPSACPPTVWAHADEELRTITQVGEMQLHEGVEACKKERSKFMQRLVAKQKARVKHP